MTEKKKSNSSMKKTPAWKEPMQDALSESLEEKVAPKLREIADLLGTEPPEREPGEQTPEETIQILADTQIKILHENSAMRAELEDIKSILRQLVGG